MVTLFHGQTFSLSFHWWLRFFYGKYIAVEALQWKQSLLEFQNHSTKIRQKISPHCWAPRFHRTRYNTFHKYRIWCFDFLLLMSPQTRMVLFLSLDRYFFYRGKSAPILISKKGGVTPWICPGEGGLFVTSKNTLYNRPSYNFFYTCFRGCFYYLKHGINLPDLYSCKKWRRITKNSALTSKTLKLWRDLIKVCAKVPSIWRVKKM